MNQLVNRKDILLITLAGGPTQQGQKVNQGLGQITRVAKFKYALRAVTLAQFFAVGPQHIGHMRKLGQFPAKRLVNLNVLGCTRQPLIGAHHMRHTHQMIINHRRQVISRKTVGLE